MNLRNTYLASFINLLFPQLCQACKATLLGTESLICTNCFYNLPYTNFHTKPDNAVAKQFWGKVSLHTAYALFYFEKGGKVQHLMHQFKYNNMPDIGIKLGDMAATQLLQHPMLGKVDAVIPVPLHKKRLRKRGYNQSACFAKGLSGKLNAEVHEDNLIRQVNTATQTHKSRFARFENMQEVFEIRNPERLTNRHILLVDDIMTTGSTLESCSQALLKVPGLKLSIATIALAI